MADGRDALYASAVPDDLPDSPLASYNPDVTEILQSADTALPLMVGDAPLPSWNIRAAGAAPSDAPTHYELRDLAGEGGFGEVWQAVQVPLQRVVALKRIRSGFAPKSQNSSALIRETFRLEAITAARLEHPNIVPVYDLGADADGQPVMAMKYVRGTLWSDLLYSDLARLPVHDFLSRHLPTLITVTQAVAFAHSRGVIHRDLKPSQVMIGGYGEVLLMDWGLAAAVARTGDAGASAVSGMVTNPAGTVAYMAPEQTEASADRLGPWTDVYLLGGILYTLLTGEPPHVGEDSASVFRQAAIGEVRHPRQAARGRLVPDELADLAMAALERDVEKRIRSAEEFHARLQDYFSGAGQRRESNAITVRAAELLPNAVRYDDFSAVLAQLAQAISLWSDNPVAWLLRDQALEGFARKALENRDLVLARFEAQQIVTAELRDELLREVGVAEAALGSQQRQRRLAVIAAAVLAFLLLAGWAAYTRDIAKERDRVRQAVVQEAQARDRAEDLLRFMLTDLKTSLDPIGRIDLLDRVTKKATGYFEAMPPGVQSAEALAGRAQLFDALGEVQWARGNIAEALEAFDHAFAIRRDLVRRDPRQPDWRADLGLSHEMRGRMFREQGDDAAAMHEFDQALALLRDVTRAVPKQHEWRRRLGSAYLERGELFGRSGDTARAVASLREGVAIMQQLHEAESHDGERLRDLAVAHGKLGDALSAQGDGAGALAEYVKYRNGAQQLVARAPGNLQWQRELAVAHNSIGWHLRGTGDTPGALAEFRRQRAIMESVVAREPGNGNWQRELAFSSAVIGRMLRAAGDVRGATDNMRAARDILREFSTRDPSNGSWRRDHAAAEALYGDVLAASGNAQEGLRSLTAAVAIMRELTVREPENVGWRHDLAQFQRYAGAVELRSGDRAAAVAHLTNAADLLAPLTRDLAAAPPSFLDTRAVALMLLGRLDEARPLVDALKAKQWSDPEFVKLARANRLM